ncbi:MAG: DUF4118 domain-containing protein [Solirubrobacterales bacterium]|nr:DUF4118 domain-containing protein [Solirubrobacterales bacterium]
MWLGVVAALAGVALATAIVYPLKEAAPVVSLGVVWLLVVLPVSVTWGLWLGIATSFLSALAFNYFHIAPTGRFTVADSENWVALVAFLVVAAVASTIAEVARARTVEAEQRREEAGFAAEAARLLLGGERLEDGLAATGERVAAMLDLPSASIRLDGTGTPDRSTFPLQGGAACLDLPAPLRDDVRERVQERVVPALDAVLGAALERDALQREVVETAALRRSDDLKTAILRSVSHDLRSPLTAMVAAGEALGSPTLDEDDRRELSAAVADQGARLSRVIEKLLDLSRLQSGVLVPRLEPVALDEVLVAANEHVGEPHLVRLQLDRDLPPVRGDAAQLERAFSNLIENAVRHSRGMPVSVRARVVGPRLVVRVVDQGPGIPPAEQAHIFEPFHAGTSKMSGSGLGLAVVKGFVEASGGEVRVESLPGQGATFVVTFPVAP